MGILTPKERAEFIYGIEMQPCPKCGSYDIGYRAPIKFPCDPKLAANREAPVEGPVYMACNKCLHYGPSMDCSGMTSREVGESKDVAKEVKRLWNEQSK